ncbi:segregation and condensation protein B [Geomicrobium halophilum]|uniref:Segregation and condensation protein B n=1 Tax=Geomicrobium halophilum TaxID=549000 RepID=A0A841PX50_9BACL|nr:SMC-Scp complex subunit ScpB [Geomicrobium halophilum]MBB6448983.1 segregation and condensation protein B [Geomicrobium halophilum]
MNEDIDLILETLLYVSGDEGLEVRRAAEAVGIDKSRVITELERIASQYEEEGRALSVQQFGESFKMVTRAEFSEYVERYASPPQRGTLSQAALETLAIVAYEQPVTRLDVEEIRGVKVDRAMTTLVGKGLVEESGRAKGVGRAILYKTTPRFLDVFNLSSLDDLPTINDNEQTEQMDLFMSSYREQHE